LGKPAKGPPVLYFGSRSDKKLQQYGYLLRCFGAKLSQAKTLAPLTEPQVEGDGRDSEQALVSEPLKLFSRFTERDKSYPFVVEDTMLFIEHFNEDFKRRPILPGPDTKRWWAALGIDGVLRTMKGSKRRSAIYVCQLGANLAGGTYRYYRAEVQGQIALASRSSPLAEASFPYANPTFFHKIFVPDGSSRTLAEMEPSEFRLYDYRRKCLRDAIPELLANAKRVDPSYIEHPETLFTLSDGDGI
jgi:inosine/xanthosine triphosphate pyrophosphatase family protein